MLRLCIKKPCIRKKTLNYLVLFFFVILGFCVSSLDLGKASYHNDELALLHHQSLDLPRLIEFCLNWAYHPPLYFLFLKGWVTLGGEEEAFTRFLSILFFSIIPVLPFWFRRVLTFPWWQFSLILVLSYPLLLLSRMVEPYSMASLFCLATWLQILEWYDRPIRTSGGFLILGLTLCFYTHYLAWAFCIIFCAFIFLELFLSKKTDLWKTFLVLGLCHLILILPWIGYNLSFKKLVLSQVVFWNIKPSLMSSGKDVLYFLFSNEKLLFLTWLIIVVRKLFISKKNQSAISVLVLTIITFGLIIIYRSLGPYSYLIPRYFLWFVPVIYFIFLSSLPRKGGCFLLGLFFALHVRSIPSLYDVEWQEVREPFILTAMQGQGERCEEPVILISHNTLWFMPYVNKYGRCGIEHKGNQICNNGIPSFLKDLPSPAMVILYDKACPDLDSLILLDPNQAGIHYFKDYRLLILGKSREKFLKEIYSIPQVKWPF